MFIKNYKNFPDLTMAFSNGHTSWIASTPLTTTNTIAFFPTHPLHPITNLVHLNKCHVVHI